MMGEAEKIFNDVWRNLEKQRGKDVFHFPDEIILLGGAPGAGKGTQTRFILKAKKYSSIPIVISDLLTTPEMEKIKAVGGMVGDREVIELLFKKMMEPAYQKGALVDGFPRTKIQVECMKQLVKKAGLTDSIHVVVLFVSEQVSIERQLRRGQEIIEQNRIVRESGEGQEIELRETDSSEEAARHRYKVFTEMTWEPLQSLRGIYQYHHIDAEGTIEEVQENILKSMIQASPDAV